MKPFNTELLIESATLLPQLDFSKPTAVIIVDELESPADNVLQHLKEYFPDYFRNIVFVGVGVIATEARFPNGVEELTLKTQKIINKHVKDCEAFLHVPATSVVRAGFDVVQETFEACATILQYCPCGVVIFEEPFYKKPRWYHSIFQKPMLSALKDRLGRASVPVVSFPTVVNHSQA